VGALSQRHGDQGDALRTDDHLDDDVLDDDDVVPIELEAVRKLPGTEAREAGTQVPASRSDLRKQAQCANMSSIVGTFARSPAFCR
jgi:hypothetical protein